MDMAAMNYDTDDVVRKIEEKTHNQYIGRVESQNADSDSQSDIDCDKEIAKEKRKLKLIKTTRMRGENAGFSTPKSLNEPQAQSTSTRSAEKAIRSQLILVELRVQTTVMNQLSFNTREWTRNLRTTKVLSRLSSISSQTPNVFARNFVLKRHSSNILTQQNLAPFGDL